MAKDKRNKPGVEDYQTLPVVVPRNATEDTGPIEEVDSNEGPSGTRKQSAYKKVEEPDDE